MASRSLYLAFYISAVKSVISLAFARLYSPQRPILLDLSGQIAIVTGANSGIGLAVATSLACEGATVYLACRNLEKGRAAVDSVVSQIGAEEKHRVHCWKLDVGDLDSVRAFCERWAKEGRKIDILVHNAGIAEPPPGARNTDDKGRDLVFMTNFIGSFLMTHLLERHLSADARVLFTSSTGHYASKSVLQSRPPSLNIPAGGQSLVRTVVRSIKTYMGIGPSSTHSYAHSKAAQVLFVHLLQVHFSSQSKRTAHAFSPGFTRTPIFHTIPLSLKTWFSDPLYAVLKATEKYLAVDPQEGAQTGVWLAMWGGVEGKHKVIEGGGYWDFMVRRTSLVDLVRGSLGEDAFREKCRGVWKGWEEDAGCLWGVEI